MTRKKVDFVEVVSDPELRKLEKGATEAVRRLYPDSEPVRLYRTADGRVGVQVKLGVLPGERERLDEMYRTVMRVLGERRGRRPGARTVQTKLRLPEDAYAALKRAAKRSRSTMSRIVADTILARFS
jgi:hypothetical protein